MKLYEISNTFEELFDKLDEISECEDAGQRAELEQAWFDTLEMLEAEFEEKAENVAAYIKLLIAEAEVLSKEERLLAARRRTKEKRIEGLKAYLLRGMQKVDLKKLDRPMAVISVRNNAESVLISDEKAFISYAVTNADELLRYKEPEINKQALKQALQSGETLPGVSLQRTQSVIIK